MLKFTSGDKFTYKGAEYTVLEIGSDGPCYVCSNPDGSQEPTVFLQSDEPEMQAVK